MRIISWNVNGLRAVYKKGFSEFNAEHKPDILCLQETKCHPDQIELPLQTPLGQNGIWASAKKKGYSGVATFSTSPLAKSHNQIGIEDYDNEGRVVWSDHGDFQLFNIYFPNGAQGPIRHAFKMRFLRDLAEFLKPKLQRGEPLIVVGDYNIAHREIDIYDPIKLAQTSGFLPEERQWFDHFLEMGFVDTFRWVKGEEPHRYSWWSYFDFARRGNRGWRIDYICVTQNLTSRIVSADLLDQVHGSDHCPVVLDLG